MAISSALYIASSYLLYSHGGLGDSALIYANSLNLLLRIAYCSQFLLSFVQHRQKPSRSIRKPRTNEGVQEEKSAELESPMAFVPPASVIISFSVVFGILRFGSTAYHLNDLTIQLGRKVVLTQQFVSFFLLNLACLLFVGGVS